MVPEGEEDRDPGQPGGRGVVQAEGVVAGRREAGRDGAPVGGEAAGVGAGDGGVRAARIEIVPWEDRQIERRAAVRRADGARDRGLLAGGAPEVRQVERAERGRERRGGRRRRRPSAAR